MNKKQYVSKMPYLINTDLAEYERIIHINEHIQSRGSPPDPKHHCGQHV